MELLTAVRDLREKLKIDLSRYLGLCGDSYPPFVYVYQEIVKEFEGAIIACTKYMIYEDLLPFIETMIELNFENEVISLKPLIQDSAVLEVIKTIEGPLN